MKITVISIGKVKDKAILNKINDFVGRIQHDGKLRLIELKDSDVESEGEAILSTLDNMRGRIFALSEEGKQYSSVEFARKIKKLRVYATDAIFVIGGPFGLSQSVKKKADETLSLSKMTLPHEMAKLFLIEQIYRALSIIKNRKYHK
jgi:23S rRNA (pseudouridine1915-N3)-methyltransferase